MPPLQFSNQESFARQLDAQDPLKKCREQFHIPQGSDGSEAVYLAGNSLGLQPKSVRPMLEEELDEWALRGVDGHFEGVRPWYAYNEMFRESGARLVGALPGEVVMMNSLTVNLHLMMVSFYRPTPGRYKILIEDPSFPSDLYAVKSQLRTHGYNPDAALLVARPRPGEHVISMEDVEELIAREGKQIALVLFSGVNFVTGQAFDIPRITRAAHAQGCMAGFDLAHAAGNVPLRLHDWNVDFGVWCNYKYLNSGPGAVAGCFVHERHGQNRDLPRFAGWWGNDPATRFRMQFNEDFVPREGADGWQISNPPIFSLAPIRASYDIFDEVGMDSLREKSLQLTGFLEFLLDQIRSPRFEIITPRDSAQRGCQLSLLVREGARELLKSLHASGVMCDFREPNIIRVAPVPLYNSFHEVWSAARAMNPSPSQGEGQG
jgi:kynureninase